jgi:putative cardiolipin synthase
MGLRVLALLLAIVASWKIARADEVAFLYDPIEAARARLDLIREARAELFVSTYIIHDDRVGQTAAALLKEAAERGVKVTVVADDFLTDIPKETVTALVNAGVDFRVYRPFKYSPNKLVNPLAYLNRMHDKLFIVDGEHLITGDRNIADAYYALTDQAFVSKEVYIKGAAAAEARSYLLDFLEKADVKKFTALSTDKKAVEAAAKTMEGLLKRLPKRVLETGAAWRARLRQVPAVSFFHDEPGAKSGKAGSAEAVLEGVRRASRSVVIENPYVILSKEFRRALQDAVDRGVRVTVFTNSQESNNQALVAAAWPETRDFLAKIGADVWELPGRTEPARRGLRPLGDVTDEQVALHSKVMVIDAKESFVMSFNMDPRSQNLNTEVGVVIRDETFAADVLGRIKDEIPKLGYTQVVAKGVKKGGRLPEKCSQLMKLLALGLKGQL